MIRITTKRLVAWLALVALAVACTAPAGVQPSHRAGFPFDWPFRGHDPIATGRNGAVATSDERATRVGLDVLQAGGSAVDAAIAAAFALAIVYPQAGNIGGGGFMVVRAADGTTAALDFREKAPLQLTPDHYLDAEGKPTSDSRIGHLAVGVPGTVAGLEAAHRRYGALPWSRLVGPAIELATNGFTVSEGLHAALVEKQGRLTRFETTSRTFYPGGEPPRPGSVLRQPILAETLRTIAREGKDAFYRGRIAELLVREMRNGGGLITREDLSRYTAEWRDPIAFEYRGHRIISMSPPSSGGVTMGEILNILEGYELKPVGFNTPELIHLYVEAFRRAFADRNYYLGDPDVVDIPIDRLLSEQYAAELRTGISRSRASESETFNRVPLIREGSHTTHISVVDGAGNAVALTYTINSSFGSGVMVEGGGFFLNNEMDDFTVRPGYSNQYGLVQSERNLVGPGRRPLSAMAPTIVLDPSGQLRAVLGSPGGPKIITAVTQVIINIIDFGMDVRTAVDAPRVHHQLFPDKIMFETDGVDGVTLGTLARMGHEISPGEGYFGDVNLIVRGADGMLHGASDPRREDGRALGY